MPGAASGSREIEVSMAARDDQREGLRVQWGRRAAARSRRRLIECGRRGFAFIEENSVNVAFEMINGNERKVVRESQRLGVGDADQKGAGKAWTRGNSDGV